MLRGVLQRLLHAVHVVLFLLVVREVPVRRHRRLVGAAGRKARLDGEVMSEILGFLVRAWAGERVTDEHDVSEVRIAFVDFIQFCDDLG